MHDLKQVWKTASSYVAECQCGWQSALHGTDLAATNAHAEHVREARESEVDAAASEGMEHAQTPDSAKEWRDLFFRGLPKFMDRWEANRGTRPFTIHDMYDYGLPPAPGGGDCAGPAMLAAAKAGIIVRVGERKSTRTTQHRRVSTYVRAAVQQVAS